MQTRKAKVAAKKILQLYGFVTSIVRFTVWNELSREHTQLGRKQSVENEFVLTENMG